MRKKVDGSFTTLGPTFHDIIAFESIARETYARFRRGDSFVASGYVHEYEVDGREGSVIKDSLSPARSATTSTRPTTSSTAADTLLSRP